MKLLFDQNISFKIISKLIHIFPESQLVRMAGLENKADIEIWNYAKLNNMTTVTFDADFFDIANLKGHPPKVIWLRIGNNTTENIAQLFSKKIDLLKDFIENTENNDIACLEIG